MAEKLDPTRLKPAELTKLLAQAGAGEVRAKQIAEDVERGAPTNKDGTLHLVHYAAWLARRAP